MLHNATSHQGLHYLERMSNSSQSIRPVGRVLCKELLKEVILHIVGFVSYKRKYMHEVLVNCLFKLAQEKVWLGKLTVPQ